MTSYPIIDTHAHVYGEQYAEDLEETLQRAVDVGVETILLSNVDVESYPLIMEVIERYPSLCRAMIGLHPTSVEEDYIQQLAFLRKELEEVPERFVSIGEIGLDYYWSTERKKEQNDALRTQLEWSAERQLPVSLHSREATLDCILAIKEVGQESLRGVFHSFTGTREELEEILELDHFMVGINGVVTFKNSDLSEVICDTLPPDRIVVETDSPYLSPVPKRGKRNEPSHIPHILCHLSEIYSLSKAEFAQVVYDNAKRMFSL